MKESEIIRVFAVANRAAGYTRYADILEKAATVKAAEEITQGGNPDESQ